MRKTVLTIAAAACCIAVTASAPAAPLSVRDSFRIGSGGTSFCSAQSVTTDKALTDMFDAGYSITCRDAALPVGKLYKLRDAASGAAAPRRRPRRRGDLLGPAPGDVSRASARSRRSTASSRTPTSATASISCARASCSTPPRASPATTARCSSGLRSLVADQPVKGEISIATTGAGDPAAFARVQAGTLDPAKALAEAYRRNNAGSYAEAAEFFAAVSNAGEAPLEPRRRRWPTKRCRSPTSAAIAEADSLFARAAELVGADPIVARRLRNYRAIHLLNQGDAKDALAELDKPLPKAVREAEARRRRRARHRYAPPPSGSTPNRKLGQQLGAAVRRAAARPKRPRSSTARRCSCAARRCA